SLLLREGDGFPRIEIEHDGDRFAGRDEQSRFGVEHEMGEGERPALEPGQRALRDEHRAGAYLAHVVQPDFEDDRAAALLLHGALVEAERLPEMTRAVREARHVEARIHVAEIVAFPWHDGAAID